MFDRFTDNVVDTIEYFEQEAIAVASVAFQDEVNEERARWAKYSPAISNAVLPALSLEGDANMIRTGLGPIVRFDAPAKPSIERKNGRVRRISYPNGSFIDFLYDADGNILALVDSTRGTLRQIGGDAYLFKGKGADKSVEAKLHVDATTGTIIIKFNDRALAIYASGITQELPIHLEFNR